MDRTGSREKRGQGELKRKRRDLRGDKAKAGIKSQELMADTAQLYRNEKLGEGTPMSWRSLGEGEG